jgi:hypothetical protein
MRRVRPKMYRLSENQEMLLALVAKQCSNEDCTGACNLGYYEPVEGWALRSARSLERLGLLFLVNGSHPRWIAAHVTRIGRDLAPQDGAR